MTGLPSGRVTMLFTDIEGSTRLLEALGDRYGDVLARHRALLREAWIGHRGVEVGTEGDSFFVAFADAQDAVDAAIAAQRALRAETWPDDARVRVRIGLHTGHPNIHPPGDGDYWGADVHIAARVSAAAHGGQILLTRQAAELVRAELEDLGEWRLKDFDAPVRLLQPVIDGEGADCFPPPRALDVRRSNLPHSPTPLVGRDTQLAEISQMLTRSSGRVVTILGPGGAGKTRLALEVGHGLLEHFRDGVFFADLSAIRDPKALARAAADAIGAAGRSDSTVDAGVGDYVQERHLLLILDNCEHVLDGVAVVAGWLETAPGLRVLATSQAPLRLRAEQCVQLASLGAAAAHRLFVDRVRAIDASFAVTEDNADAVAEICVRLEGMPMAIELAAARCTALSPRELAGRLREDVLSLAARARDMPARQRSLQAAMDWTVGLLAPEQRTLLARLSVFSGQPTLDRAQAVCGDAIDPIDAIEALVEFSLLRREADGRLRMPQSIAAYAHRMLHASGEEAELRRRHAAVMAGVAEHHHASFMLDTAAVLVDAAAERADLFAALDLAARHDAALHARLAGNMALPLLMAGPLMAIEADVERALAHETQPTRARLRLLIARGAIAYARGARELERASFEQAIVVAKGLGDDEERALTLAVFAKAVTSGEQPSVDAFELLAAARSLAASVQGDGFLDLLDGLAGEAHLVEGRIDEAAALIAGAVHDGRARHFAAFSAGAYMSDFAFFRGNYLEALEGYVGDVRASHAAGLVPSTTWQVESVGLCLMALGHHARGLTLIGAAQACDARIDMQSRPRYTRRVLDEHLRVARAVLGEDEAEAALERGRQMQWEIAVGLALRARTAVRPAPASLSRVPS